MNKKQVIVLWIIAAALVVTLAVVRARLSDSPEASTKFSRGDQLAADLDPNQIQKVVISGADNTTTLVKGADKWTVAERQDYSADLPRLGRAVDELLNIEAVQAYEAGPKYDPRFGMNKESEAAADHGLHLDFLGEGGESLLKVSLGKESSEPPQTSDPMAMMNRPQPGRYLRVSTDPESIYVITGSLRDFEANPAAWLNKDFLKVSKIKSITLRAPDDKDFEPWTVMRENATDALSLEGLGDNEELQTSAVNPLGNLFANLRFSDVVEAGLLESDGDKANARQAIITTFEGFTYTLNLTPKKAAEKLSEDDFNPGAENYFLTVTVNAELAQEREKKPDESEEEAKAADEQFAAEKTRLEKKLATEQSYQGRTYELTKWSLNALLKARGDLAQTKEEAPGATPSGGASVVSPPIQIPLAPPAATEEADPSGSPANGGE
mgnify:CR=1 FL=1